MTDPTKPASGQKTNFSRPDEGRSRSDDADDFSSMIEQSWLLNAIETLPAGFVLFDENGDFLYCNQTQRDFYPHVADLYRSGTNRRDILMRHAKNLSREKPDLDVEKYIADRLDRVLSARPDAETRLADGRWVVIRERVIAGGGMVSIRTDISARKKAEAELEEARMELENHVSALEESKTMLERQASELARLAEEQAALNARLEHEVAVKDMFFSIISHDLRNPFTPILGMSKLMATSAEKFSKEKLILFAEGIGTASQQYFDVLEKLLQWARLQMSGVEIRPETISISALTREAIELLKPMALEKAIRLTFQDTTATAFADAGMAQSVLQNLVTNSLKFTPAGGNVDISAQERDGMVRVTISDTGVGISLEDEERVFALNQKTSTPGTNGELGSGLGLPLCKEMVEKNGGQIWFDSQPGNGARFHFTLPKVSVHAA